MTLRKDLPGHISPTFSAEAREDALFHYTTAAGLIGILSTNQIWSTAYYCANDESELDAGSGTISPIFRGIAQKMVQERHKHAVTFANRGVDIRDYAENFERRIIAQSLSLFCAFISCFCKAEDSEDFHHGRLSQWRGYGIDGGYALQFSRKKLLAQIDIVNSDNSFGYDLRDVYYKNENELKLRVIEHRDAFAKAFHAYLDDLASLDFNKPSISNPLINLTGGPLERLLDYLVHTKSPHFAEERECRLSRLDPVAPNLASPKVEHFNRSGLLVPYTRTPADKFDILGCIEWIIVGPSPRITARITSVNQMVRHLGLDIKVRPSHIPLARN
jgi:hypothetical protein